MTYHDLGLDFQDDSEQKGNMATSRRDIRKGQGRDVVLPVADILHGLQ